MSRFCMYCGNEVAETWSPCCGEVHNESEEERNEREWAEFHSKTGETFEQFVARMEAQQEQPQ